MQQIKIRDTATWESFLSLSESGTFTAAAKKLRVSVPVLSKRISGLEAELGIQLFVRSTRKMSLTDEAKRLIPQVKNILDEWRQLEGQFEIERGSEVSGSIRISCLPAFAHRHLAKILLKFRALHPGVHFDIHLSDHIVDMIEYRIDLSLRVQEPRGADYIYRKLIPNELIFSATPKYLAKHGTPKSLEDLKKHEVLMLPIYRNCRFKNSDQRLQDISRGGGIESDNGLFLTELALSGGGIAVRSAWDVGPLIATGKLVQVLAKYPIENLGNIYAVTPPGKLIPKRLRLFLDFLSREVGSLI